MSRITRDDVVQLAALSSLQLDQTQIDTLTRDISNILEHVADLRELDTSTVSPTYQTTGLEFVARSDEVQSSTVSSGTLLELAPDAHNHQVKVPKVL